VTLNIILKDNQNEVKMKTNPESILRMARLRRGLSQGEVEAATGIWQPTLSLYERGLREVPASARARLARLYKESEKLLFPAELDVKDAECPGAST
jgi:transcriptional regulator with XRE-family HTH domain